MFKKPTDYAAMLLAESGDDFTKALMLLGEAPRTFPEVMASFWADVAIALVHAKFPITPKPLGELFAEEERAADAEPLLQTGVFLVKPGEYQAILDGRVIRATFNSHGAAVAGLQVEARRRAARKVRS